MQGVEDPLLPAAEYLSGAAADVLTPAVAATGARLVDCRAVQVQYRPGRDLVVRYRADVVADDGTPDQLTLMAATTADGPPPGTLVVEADRGPGRPPLAVGVWKWPFDPYLPRLTDLATPSLAAQLLDGVVQAPVTVEVVVYRPTDRAVARVTGADGRVVYAKAVRPGATAALAERHAALAAAGLPVPQVAAADHAAGWLALDELRGPTLRDLVREGRGEWPAWEQFADLRDRLAAVPTTVGAARPSRRGDASAHAAMLAAVLPAEAARLERIAAAVNADDDARPTAAPVVVHGDLHEAQLIVEGGRIVGLLDLDDVGPGDPLDDLANLLAHLRYRAAAATVAGTDGAPVATYTDALRAGFGRVVDDPRLLDTTTAAALVGMATGPFRIQLAEWEATTSAVLDVAERLLRR